MHTPFKEFFARQPVVILDGAMATELERRGADLRDALWSARVLIDRPELIRSVHLDYLRAGADVVTTATYQASFDAFARRGIGNDEAERLMCDAVSLATEARDEFWNELVDRRERMRPLIAASVGPYGATLADGSEYRGGYTLADRALTEFHLRRLDVLVASRPDLLACETLPCLREALILAQLLTRWPNMTAWISFSCRDGAHTSEGDDVGDCIAALAAYPQITAVGVNCTPPQFVASLLRRMAARAPTPLLAYPNSGERYDADLKSWEGTPYTSHFGARAPEWRAAGARLIGGCCRTSPADIRELRAALL